MTASVASDRISALSLHAQVLRLEQRHGNLTQHTARSHHYWGTGAATLAIGSTSTRSHQTAAATAVTSTATAQRHVLTDLTVSGHGSATPTAGSGALATYAPVASALTPTQVQTAYGVNTLSTSNQGQGTTIAIVDEFDDPNITNDANVFSAQYNLPKLDGLSGDPTLKVVKDQTLGTVTSAAGTGVGGETSLDVEWAHAIAPQANILLVEVPASGSLYNQFAQLLQGVQYAASQPGVDAVSLSYGYTEAGLGTSNVKKLDSTYLSTGAATTVPVTVSTGDSSTPSYPALSPSVLAVGGTSLYLSSAAGAYNYETAWGDSPGDGAGGGGLSKVFATPAYQANNNANYGARAIPDVSLIADPATGVSFYDSLDTTSQYPNPWGQVGGTSLAAPVYAAMVDLAQQNRIAAGLPLLTSSKINSEVYAIYNSSSYSTYFHDITQGNNTNVGSNGRVITRGYATATGFDGATGVGSPIGSTFIPLLSSL